MKRIFALISVLILSGCGYALQGGGSVLPPDVKNIYLPTAQNNSTELGLALVVTDAIREQFEGYGVVTMLDSIVGADAIMRVKILSVKQNTRSVSAGTNAAGMQAVRLTVGAELSRLDGQVLWSDPGITVSTTFGSDPTSVVTSSSEFAGGTISSGDLSSLSSRDVSRNQGRQALITLADTLAQTMYDKAIAPDF